MIRKRGAMTMIRKHRASYIILALIAIMLLLMPYLSAHAQPPGPQIFDLSGAQRDQAWLQGRYGNVRFTMVTDVPHFKLARLDATTGPATIVVRVLDARGLPAYRQPVALSWPGISCQPGDPNIRILDPAYKTRLAPCAIVQYTDANGTTGFGLSTDWYYRNGEAPGIVWVLSPSIQSDGAWSIGMRMGTEHEGPLHLTFQETDASPPEPTPTSPVATPLPPPGPPPADLSELTSTLRELVAVLKAIGAHFGVTY